MASPLPLQDGPPIKMSSFSSYLRSSTIHGLSYLAEGAPAARLAWLACISASVWTASVLIAGNIRNWQQQTGVVSSVNDAIVVGQPWMPQLALCPHATANVNNLLVGLLREDTNVITDDVLRKLNSVVAALIIESKIKELWSQCPVHALTRLQAEACLNDDDAAEVDEGCRLPKMLAIMTREMGKTYSVGFVLRYLADKHLDDNNASRPSLSDLEAAFDSDNAADNLTYGDLARGRGGSTWYQSRNVQELYTLFFPPAFNEACGESVGGAVRTLEDYRQFDKDLVVGSIAREDMPSLLKEISDARAIGHLRREEQQHNLVDRLQSLLDKGVFSRAIHGRYRFNDEEIKLEKDARLLSYLAYDSARSSFALGVTLDPEGPNWPPCGQEEGNFSRVCGPVDESDRYYLSESSCTIFYCDRVKAMDRRALGRAYDDGAEEAGAPGGLLPSCLVRRRDRSVTVKTDDCWKKVVTDVGPCFLTEQDQTVALVGQQPVGLYLLSPKTPLLSVFKPKRKYDLFVLPPHQLTSKSLLSDGVPSTTISEDDLTGKRYRVDVSVQQVIGATEVFRQIDPESRGCLFSDERTLRNFPSYSESSCVVECAGELARTECGCIPWFLAEFYPDTDVCELHGNTCFKEIVDGRYDSQIVASHGCLERCPRDCEKVKYSATFTTQPASEYKDPGNLGSLISLQVQGRITNKVVLTASVTTVDMISNVGGVLGLFCGFSILSIVEFAYWMGKAVCTGNFRRKKGRLLVKP